MIEFFILDNPKMPGTRASKFWNDLFLPLAPLANGAIVAVLFGDKLPLPADLHSLGVRITYGLVAGLLSGFVYRILRALLLTRAGLSPADDDKLSPFPPYPYAPYPYPPQPYPYPPHPHFPHGPFGAQDGYAQLAPAQPTEEMQSLNQEQASEILAAQEQEEQNKE
jgi:hypothetical protein